MKPKAVIVSGYFNPLHRGHIELFHKAKSNGDSLFVIVNNDYQRKLKNSKKFMLEDERVLIINELKITDKVFLSIDKDRTVNKTLEFIFENYSKSFELIFANGGDQNIKTISESEICNKLGIELIYNLGEKVQSSSWLLKRNNDLK
jgi:cytidyltransferase-like protein|tara:strand:+ start:3052 stop:3489 length:438 start_codon:yes stop_codon:yes gene_type:complete